MKFEKAVDNFQVKSGKTQFAL